MRCTLLIGFLQHLNCRLPDTSGEIAYSNDVSEDDHPDSLGIFAGACNCSLLIRTTSAIALLSLALSFQTVAVNAELLTTYGCEHMHGKHARTLMSRTLEQRSMRRHTRASAKGQVLPYQPICFNEKEAANQSLDPIAELFAEELEVVLCTHPKAITLRDLVDGLFLFGGARQIAHYHYLIIAPTQ